LTSDDGLVWHQGRRRLRSDPGLQLRFSSLLGFDQETGFRPSHLMFGSLLMEYLLALV